MATVTIPDKLKSSIKKIVKDEGLETEDKFIQEAIGERLHLHVLLSKKDEVKELTAVIQKKMKEKGITEGHILDDFKEFRERLYK